MLLRSLRLRSSFVLVAGLVAGALASVPTVAEARLPAAGKPAFKAGDPEGFWVWRDDAGWHVRATTGKAQHAFRGVLRAKAITDVSVTRNTLLTHVTATDDVLRFEFDLFAGGMDGFDFKTADPCISFELRIDTKPQPARVHVGAGGKSPELFPFDACQ